MRRRLKNENMRNGNGREDNKTHVRKRKENKELTGNEDNGEHK